MSGTSRGQTANSASDNLTKAVSAVVEEEKQRILMEKMKSRRTEAKGVRAAQSHALRRHVAAQADSAGGNVHREEGGSCSFSTQDQGPEKVPHR